MFCTRSDRMVHLHEIAACSGGSQDSVWLYYGNDSAPGGMEESGVTYDTAQVLVYHLGEADGAPKDATTYGNHASAFAGTHGTPSAIGNGYSFKGTGDKIVVQRTPSLNFATCSGFAIAPPVYEITRGRRRYHR